MITIDELNKRMAAFVETNPRTGESKRRGVGQCEEFLRVEALDARTIDDYPASELVRLLTPIFRKPGSSASLLPVQAVALYELAAYGGVLGAIPVGHGKTLISLLACHGYRKPLLILPAKLAAKTSDEIRAYSRDWKVPKRIKIVTYDKLSRVKNAELLLRYKPDIIVCDEAHRLKNSKSALHRRVRRYVLQARPDFVALSGTLIGPRLMQWAPIAYWALKERSPAPRKWVTQQAWASALDPEAKLPGGALWRFADHAAGESYIEGYSRRVRSTPGVVTAVAGDGCGASIAIALDSIELPTGVKGAIENLAAKWELPDGAMLVNPMSFHRSMRQLELGCYYRWIERPPDEWVEARTWWGSTVRNLIKYSSNDRPLDTELQVRQAIRAGLGDRAAREALDNWASIGPTFAPQTECVWIDEGPIKALVAMAQARGPALIWVHHKEIGAKLQSLGLPYYGAGGKDADGCPIENENGKQSIVLSIASSKEGRNLQQFSRMIIAECPRDPLDLEQMIGRVHRTGQTADECSVSVLLNTENARKAWSNTLARALHAQAIAGQPLKLLVADETETESETGDD